MGDVVKMRRKRKPVSIDGVLYIPLEDAAERIGVDKATLYGWNSAGLTNEFRISYLGHCFYEERAIEPFKRSLVKTS